MRRIEAVTGEVALDRVQGEEQQLREVAALLNVTAAEIGGRVEKLLAQLKVANDDLGAARQREAVTAANALVAAAANGTVVERRDGMNPDELRQLAIATRDALGPLGVVVILGANVGKAGVVVAVGKDRVASGVSAAAIAAPVAKLLGGGTAKNPELVMGGGPNVAALDEAVAVAQVQVASAVG